MKPSTSRHPHIKWQDVKQQIEIDIISGKLRAGDRVPSLSQMTERYAVSKSTAQKALGALSDSGTIFPKPNIGYYVNPCTAEQLKDTYKRLILDQLESVLALATAISFDKKDLESIKKRIDKISIQNSEF
jgi:DNA-binding transcriptional regulator YhcF (GntR family)